MGKIIQSILDGLGEIFKPLIPAITAAGMIQGLLVLANLLGWVNEGSVTHLFINAMSQSVFYFLPILIAISAAHYFEAKAYLSVAVILLLFYPDFMELMQADGPARIFGLPLFKSTYANSVFPAIFTVWGQRYIERFSKKIVPDVLSGILVPIINLFATSLLAVWVTGPLGNALGLGLTSLIQAVGQVAHWLVPSLLGGLGIFAVMTGAHYPLFPVMLDQLSQQGYEDFFAAGMIATNIALAGATLAVIVLSKNSMTRQVGVSAFITALMGTSQPAIYGFAMKFKSVLVGSMLGGFLGGFYAGVTNFVSYGYVNPGLVALPVYVSPDGDMTNLIHGLIAMVIAFLAAFLYVFITDRKNPFPYEIED